MKSKIRLNPMTTTLKVFFIMGFMAMITCAFGQDDQLNNVEIQKILQNLKYKQGEVKIKDGLATFNVPTNFAYLDAVDAKTVLVKLWEILRLRLTMFLVS